MICHPFYVYIDSIVNENKPCIPANALYVCALVRLYDQNEVCRRAIDVFLKWNCLTAHIKIVRLVCMCLASPVRFYMGSNENEAIATIQTKIDLFIYSSQ